MNAKKRYLSVLLFSFMWFGLFILYRRSGNTEIADAVASSRSVGPQSFLTFEDECGLLDNKQSLQERHEHKVRTLKGENCRMETCFDFSKCRNEFKVYVYKVNVEEKMSPTYAELIRAIKGSKYYTTDPSEACLFILSYDTIDRDTLSKDFVASLSEKVWKLPYWNGGKNHLIFNLYSGTWPDYAEDLFFDIGQAMLAKASFSKEKLRYGFDISWPLFPKSLPEKGGGNLPSSQNIFPLKKKYLLAFKGKRYLTGVGSESRNALYHIHNGKDIVLLTTCRHGQRWEAIQDSRCQKDNAEYDKYDYDELLHNATFCLTPRGRRLGSFRFIETLDAGCIPVMLSNGWELPFSEVIDWSKALVMADERLLMQVPSIVHSIPESEILAYKQQTQFLWDAYFSSIEKTILTTIEIVHNRLLKRKATSSTYHAWNHPPGALIVSPQYSRDIIDFPFYYDEFGFNPSSTFTAVIYITKPITKKSDPVGTLAKNVASSTHCAKIIVLWTLSAAPPDKNFWPEIATIVPISSQDRNIRFAPSTLIQTDSILSLDQDVMLNRDEVNFAFSVWHTFPDRIVGFESRTHYWKDSLSKWTYSSKYSNEYSMILTSAAFYHRYYHHLFSNYLPQGVHDIIKEMNNCEDIAMNFLVSQVTRLPPVKVLTHKPYKLPLLQLLNEQKNPGKGQNPGLSITDMMPFQDRQKCFNAFVELFSSIPLLKSQVRFDPLLYKDPISNMRKRFRMLE